MTANPSPRLSGPIAALLVAMIGCTAPLSLDGDGDGSPTPADCDDANAAINPGATEVPYDGIDQDCTDGDLVDVDLDGSAHPADCDDANAAINPGATEVPYDGVDQDCADGDLVDVDGDGFAQDVDCLDTNAAVNPDADEVPYDGLDNDCVDGDLVDVDDDGFAHGVDCLDTNAAVNPDADEVPYDGLDNDCVDGDLVDVDDDGFARDVDCLDTNAAVNPDADEVPYDGLDNDCVDGDLVDVDDDGYPLDTDCDDADPSIHPAAAEACDAVDSDCDDDLDDAPGGYLTAGEIRTDVSATLLAGTAEAPAILAVTDATLTLCSGTYFAGLRASGTVSIEGGVATVLDGAGLVRPVDQPEGGSLTVRRLSIRNGAGDGSIRCVASATAASNALLVESTEVTGGRSGQGAAVWTSGCAVTVRDSDLHDNTATDSGGAIWATTGARVDLVDTVVRNNTTTGNGGGVLLVGSSGSCARSAEEKRAAIVGNTAADGGNLYLHTSDFDFTGCDLGANGTADDGVPNDVLTYDLASVRHYQGGADATKTCRGGRCGTTEIWSSAPTTTWVPNLSRITGGWYRAIMTPSRTGRLEAMFARARLTEGSDSCRVTAILESGGRSYRSEPTLVMLTDTWIGVRDAEIDMRAGGPNVEFRFEFTECATGGVLFDFPAVQNYFATWGRVRESSPVTPWEIAWTPEL